MFSFTPRKSPIKNAAKPAKSAEILGSDNVRESAELSPSIASKQTSKNKHHLERRRIESEKKKKEMKQ